MRPERQRRVDPSHLKNSTPSEVSTAVHFVAADGESSGESGAGDAGTDRPGAERAAADLAEPRSCPAYRMRWARLLARVFGHQILLCPSCGHTRTIVAAITERDVAAKLLVHLGLPTDVPVLAQARAPPQAEWFADCDPVAQLR